MNRKGWYPVFQLWTLTNFSSPIFQTSKLQRSIAKSFAAKKNLSDVNQPVEAATNAQSEASTQSNTEPTGDGESALNASISQPFKFEFAEDGEPFSLGEDIGFGLNYQHLMGRTFQEWGTTVSTDIVRLGDKALKFETREGFCGY